MKSFNVFLYLAFFSTDTGDSHDSKWKKPTSHIALYRFHLLGNIKTFSRSYASDMPASNF